MKNTARRQKLLILLCWCVYVLSYVGRYSYNANLNEISADYRIFERAVLGLPSSFFFFAYGIGQVVNGFMCKRYNKRVVIPSALILSSSCNLTVFIGIPFELFKFVWMVNGLAQSFLWTSIIHSLSTTLDKERLPQATFVMSSTIAIGTFLSYGLSALFKGFGVYRAIFLLAFIGATAIAIIWFLFYDKLAPLKENVIEKKQEKTIESKKDGNIAFVLITVVMLAVFAVLNNVIKDGLTGWTPTIFLECFNFESSFATVVTLILPIMGFIGQGVNVKLQKRITDFVLLSGLWYTITAVCLVGATISVYYGLWIIVLICFAVAFTCMLNVNNIITSMAPLYMRDSIPAGLMAGLMDGFCYVGSTISMFGLGSVYDSLDIAYGDNVVAKWGVVLSLITTFALFAVMVALIYSLSKIIKAKRRGTSIAVLTKNDETK